MLDERDEEAVNLLIEHFGGHSPGGAARHVRLPPGKPTAPRPLSGVSAPASPRCGRATGHRSAVSRSSRCSPCAYWPASQVQRPATTARRSAAVPVRPRQRIEDLAAAVDLGRPDPGRGTDYCGWPREARQVDGDRVGRRPARECVPPAAGAADRTPRWLRLDEELRSCIRPRAALASSPRHVPDRIEAVPAIPRTMTGKKLELPVKRILLGESPEKVASRDALGGDPRAIDAFGGIRLGRRTHWKNSTTA